MRPVPEFQDDRRFAVLDVRISALTMEEAVQRVMGWVQRREPAYVNVCTSDTVLRCHDDPRLAAIVNGAGMATPDGMPLVWLGRWQGFEVERVYGPDLMLSVCGKGQVSGVRHYFYGGTDQVINDLTRRFLVRFPGLQVAGFWAPPFRALTEMEEAEVVARINAARPDVVWVGIGTPKQDFWMSRFRPWLEAPVLIAVGAAFNFHAGHVRQAPRWMMRLGLEWVFRFSMEPLRLWRRYLVGVPRFMWLLVQSRGRFMNAGTAGHERKGHGKA